MNRGRRRPPATIAAPGNTTNWRKASWHAASGDAGAADILVAAGGALLYEAAKQCVNAVANLNGRDPQANHEKMAALRVIANTHPAYPHLIRGSRTAWDLHIHADQGNLALPDLASALE